MTITIAALNDFAEQATGSYIGKETAERLARALCRHESPACAECRAAARRLTRPLLTALYAATGLAPGSPREPRLRLGWALDVLVLPKAPPWPPR